MDQCLDFVDKYQYTNSQQYHYFNVSCTAFRGKLETSFAGRLKYGLKMRRIQGPASEVAESTGSEFESGGIFRVLSALRGNRKAEPLGLYDSAEALGFAQNALNTPRHDDSYFKEDYSGKDYYENYYYIAQSKIAIGIDEENVNMIIEGGELLNSKIRKIDIMKRRPGGLKERAPETLAYRELMVKLNDKVNECKGDNNWRSCLIEKLDH